MKYLFHKRTAYCGLRKGLIIMKLTVFLLSVFIFQADAGVVAQKFSINAVDLPLEKVCKEVERQTGYYFVYPSGINTFPRQVNINLRDVELNEALKKIFEPTPYTYQVIDKVIIINTRTIKNLPRSEIDTTGIIDITGVVLSDKGFPLDGATVAVINSSKTTFTDAQGGFRIRGVRVNSELLITYVGFTDQRISVNNQRIIRVDMRNSDAILDAPVVKGYYTTSNRLNTGNAVVVKGDDIQKQPVSDPLQALAGRVANLNITQSAGINGAYSTVQLRGQNSIANGLDPFYIIDGVPYTNMPISNAYFPSVLGASSKPSNPPGNNGAGYSPFNYLNPSDIESITVLKDADATAIYGSRGANGVILITTKKGKYGKTKVDVNMQAGGGRVTKMVKMLNTKQYLEMRREAFHYSGKAPNPNSDFDVTYWDTTRYTDWQKVLIGNTATFYNNQVNILGGTGNTQFLIGLGYIDQGNIFPGAYRDKKASLLANISNASSNQRFRSELNIQYLDDNNRLPQTDFTSSLYLAPNAPALYDKFGNLNWELRNGGATWSNPLANLRASEKSRTGNLITSLSLSYALLPGLKLSTRAGYTNIAMDQSNITPSSSFDPIAASDPNARSIYYGNSYTSNWIVEPQVNYDIRVKKSLFQMIIGGTLQENNFKSLGEVAYGFSSDALIYSPFAASNVQVLNYYTSKYRYNAVYGRLSYNYDEKYLINLTLRRDGSSRFGPGKQFGNFGAVGVGWIFSQEKWVHDNFPFLSYGKIRGSYGITGNDQLADYKYLDTYTPTGTSYQGVLGLSPTQITNKDYSWETVKKIELALEMGFMKDRILVSTAYFRNRTNDQLVGYALPSLSGFSNVQANLPAVIQNSGFELTISSNNLQGRNFSWRTNFNLGISRNKLVSYPGIESSSYNTTYAIGKSLSAKYLFHYTGVNPETGNYSFAAKSGSVFPSSDTDPYFTRPVSQDYQGGISNSFSVRNFQVDIFVQFVKQIGASYLATHARAGISNTNVPLAVLDTWKRYGDRASFAKLNTQAFNPYFTYLTISDAILTDASYIRLKNISVSYNIPDLAVKRMNLTGIRIYLQSQNLLTFTKYFGADPENQGSGIPPLRMLTGGLQVVF